MGTLLMRPLAGRASACKGTGAPLLLAPSAATNRVYIWNVWASGRSAQGSQIEVNTRHLCTVGTKSLHEHREPLHAASWPNGAIPRIFVIASR